MVRSATRAYFQKCTDCNVVYAMDEGTDPTDVTEGDFLPEECHVCGNEEFSLVYDENATREARRKVDGTADQDSQRYTPK